MQSLHCPKERRKQFKRREKKRWNRRQGTHLKGTRSPILPANTVTVPAPIVCNRAPTALERDDAVAEVVKAWQSPKEQHGTMRHPVCRAARTISISPPPCPCPPVLPVTIPTLFLESRSDLTAPYAALCWP
jgi:hypothetical protein